MKLPSWAGALAWDDEALTFLTGLSGADRPAVFRGRSAQSTRACLARRHEVRLAWIDGER